MYVLLTEQLTIKPQTLKQPHRTPGS